MRLVSVSAPLVRSAEVTTAQRMRGSTDDYAVNLAGWNTVHNGGLECRSRRSAAMSLKDQGMVVLVLRRETSKRICGNFYVVSAQELEASDID